MENHIVVITVVAELEEGAGGGGTLLAKEGNVDGTVGGGEDYPAGGGGLRAVHLAHDDTMIRWFDECVGVVAKNTSAHSAQIRRAHESNQTTATGYGN